MDEQTKERRGEDARRLLGDALYKESWQAVRERIVVMLEHPETTKDERTRLNNALVGLRDARRWIEQVMVSGTLAAKDMQRKRTIAERILHRA